MKSSANKIQTVPLSSWKEKQIPALLRKSSNKTITTDDDFSNYVFSPDNFSESNNGISFKSPNLKDNNGEYRQHKYITRFTLDYARAYYTYDSYYGSSAMGVFLFSDILGDHKATFGIELQSEISESDFFMQYRY